MSHPLCYTRRMIKTDMKAKIEINMDNEAFTDETYPDRAKQTQLSWLFRNLAKRIEEDPYFMGGINLQDVNGNTVGRLEIVED